MITHTDSDILLNIQSERDIPTIPRWGLIVQGSHIAMTLSSLRQRKALFSQFNCVVLQLLFPTLIYDFFQEPKTLGLMYLEIGLIDRASSFNLYPMFCCPYHCTTLPNCVCQFLYLVVDSWLALIYLQRYLVGHQYIQGCKWEIVELRALAMEGRWEGLPHWPPSPHHSGKGAAVRPFPLSHIWTIYRPQPMRRALRSALHCGGRAAGRPSHLIFFFDFFIFFIPFLPL